MVESILIEQNPWWDESGARPEPIRAHRRDAFEGLYKGISDGGRQRATVLLGPRQVGKTTLMKQVLSTVLDHGWAPPNLTFFDLADDRLAGAPDPRQILLHRPPGFREDRPRLLFLDELQRFDGWADWLRREVDRGRTRIFASGSSMGLLRQGGVETGQGRWDEVFLEAMTFQETLRLLGGPGRESELLLQQPQLFERFLKTGGMPEFALEEPSGEMRARLRSDIANKAIMRDLQPHGVDVGQIRVLFFYLVRESGAIFNAAARAADLDANRKSVSHWVGLLEDTGLIASLPPVHSRSGGKARRALRPKPKIYAADHGLIDAFWPGQHSRPEELRSRVYEAVVFRQLRWIAAGDPDATLSYFREGDLEIDFVLDYQGRRMGVEVTGSSRSDRKWSRMRKAKERGAFDRMILVHGGYAHEAEGELTSLPLRDFLREPVHAVLGGRDE